MSLLARVAVTVALALVALLHALFPGVKIDAVTVTLLAVAAVPWLAPLLSSLDLPGLKISFRELQEVERKARDAGLLAQAPPQAGAPAYMAVADQDPNLAMAGLRIEIERRLRGIAASRGIDASRTSAGRLASQLAQHGALSQQEQSVIIDILGTLNRAVHGAEVDPSAATWVMDVGPNLLASLDQKVEG